MTLKQHRRELIKTLMEYESDTFSATASNITRKEAEAVADRFIDWLFYQFIYDRLDGIRIAGELEAVRDN